MAEDWIEKLIREYQDTITGGLYQGVYRLDGEALGSVMEEQAQACVHAFVKLYGIDGNLELDQFLEKMATGGSSKVRIERDGKRIIWEEQHAGECMCPLVKRQVIALDPKLCTCAVHWLRMLVRRHTSKSVRVELVDSVARGSRNCTFEITID